MISGTNNERWENLLLVALFATIMFFAALHEDYLSSITLLLWVSLVKVGRSGIVIVQGSKFRKKFFE